MQTSTTCLVYQDPHSLKAQASKDLNLAGNADSKDSSHIRLRADRVDSIHKFVQKTFYRRGSDVEVEFKNEFY